MSIVGGILKADAKVFADSQKTILKLIGVSNPRPLPFTLREFKSVGFAAMQKREWANCKGFHYGHSEGDFELAVADVRRIRLPFLPPRPTSVTMSAAVGRGTEENKIKLQNTAMAAVWGTLVTVKGLVPPDPSSCLEDYIANLLALMGTKSEVSPSEVSFEHSCGLRRTVKGRAVCHAGVPSAGRLAILTVCLWGGKK